MRLFKQDKGQKDCVQSFVNSIIEGKDTPIPYVETIESSRISIEVANALRG
jgi:hypothetical protein